MNWAARLGRFQFYRGKGQQWIEIVRGWVAPAALSGGFTKYIGFQSRWAIAAALLLPLVVETAGVLLGRWLYRRGGVRADYQLARDADPFKTESLALLAEIRDAARRQIDDPECDGTDNAHPAWWRGNDQGVAVLCAKVADILDGKDDGRGVSREPWDGTRRRLLGMMEVAQKERARAAGH